MDLRNHGGKCCGITHIEGFYGCAKYNLAADERGEGSMDPLTIHNSPGKVVGFGKAPAENLPDRLKRMVDFVEKKRPGGIIEAVLAGNQKGMYGQMLLDAGFVLVTPEEGIINSNSKLALHVYMKFSGYTPKARKEEKKVSLRNPSSTQGEV